MPTIRIWCCWEDCRKPQMVSGDLPAICPECHEMANWTTTPPYRLTRNDDRFLKSIRIDPEREP